jgi:hypothetical protein
LGAIVATARSFRHLLLSRCHFLFSDSASSCLCVNKNYHKKNSPLLSPAYLPEAESFGNQSGLHSRCLDLASEFQRPVRPDEIVMAVKQLEMIFEAFLPSCLTYRPPTKIRRALSDRQIQPFDKGCVPLRGILGVAQCLFESPGHADHGSSLNLDNTIVPADFNDLALQTRLPKV